MSRVKIVLDADVIIHFAKGKMLSMLPSIFGTYDYIVLLPVYEELKGGIKTQLDNQVHLLKNISIEKFTPSGEVMKEYAMLLQTRGKGESACMAYCRFNHEVIGSSNLADIKTYCNTHKIRYLTTFDFLYHAIQKGIITLDDAKQFRSTVVANGSRLPSERELEAFESSVQL